MVSAWDNASREYLEAKFPPLAKLIKKMVLSNVKPEDVKNQLLVDLPSTAAIQDRVQSTASAYWQLRTV